MRTLDYLFGETASLYRPAVLAAGAVVTLCAPLSVIIVLRRLALIGQGVSHAAFGGIGVWAMLGVMFPVLATTGTTWPETIVVTLFCLCGALGMAAMSRSSRIGADTAIALFLVASMAVGALLVHWSAQIAASSGRPPVVWSFDAILFGSILSIGPADTVVVWILALVVCAIFLWVRRPLLFWAFDEQASSAFGVNGSRMETILMVLIALAVVVAMKMAGIIMATALFVLPGAAALQLTRRLWPVFILSWIMGMIGVMVGLVVTFEWDLQPGPSIVLSMSGLLVLCWVVGVFANRVAPPV